MVNLEYLEKIATGITKKLNKITKNTLFKAYGENKDPLGNYLRDQDLLANGRVWYQKLLNENHTAPLSNRDLVKLRNNRVALQKYKNKMSEEEYAKYKELLKQQHKNAIPSEFKRHGQSIIRNTEYSEMKESAKKELASNTKYLNLKDQQDLNSIKTNLDNLETQIKNSQDSLRTFEQYTKAFEEVSKARAKAEKSIKRTVQGMAAVGGAILGADIGYLALKNSNKKSKEKQKVANNNSKKLEKVAVNSITGSYRGNLVNKDKIVKDLIAENLDRKILRKKWMSNNLPLTHSPVIPLPTDTPQQQYINAVKSTLQSKTQDLFTRSKTLDKLIRQHHGRNPIPLPPNLDAIMDARLSSNIGI